MGVAVTDQVSGSVSAALDALETLYREAIEAQRAAINRYAADGVAPTPKQRRAFCYPLLSVEYRPGGGDNGDLSRAFGMFTAPGRYAVTITRPELFRPYLEEQLSLLDDAYDITVEVSRSTVEIPYPYVLRDAELQALGDANPRDLARAFPSPDLSTVTDDVADGATVSLLGAEAAGEGARPLALFDAQRTDYSLHRLRHYTGAPADHIQDFILFTNYQLYVDSFGAWAAEQLRTNPFYTGLSLPGGDVVTRDDEDIAARVEAASRARVQMPAFHLMAEGRAGVTLLNIGVGPSNAKTITDHLAVMRPQCWLMIGHCGGLRQEQRLGDYVLAHAYLRRDKVLDALIPLEAPIPAIAEIQIALQKAASDVTGARGKKLKQRLRTGTVVTNADRNWELRAEAEATIIAQARAVAVDMESATVAANGYRLRVPYGVLLCVSDKPFHGELKLPGPARRFYDQAVGQHLMIGLRTLELLREDGAEALHSRKLRSFDEPPFR